MSDWSRVPLGDLLRRSDEAAVLAPEAEYHEVTIRLWGKGVVSRGVVRGTDVTTPRRFVREGQLILSKIDARNGAIGIVPPELDGAVVSNDFPSFSIAGTDRCLPAYLDAMVKSPSFIDLCRGSSEGTTNRVRLKEDRFLREKIALPPLQVQKTIVRRLDNLTDKIRQLTNHLDGIEADADRLLIGLATRADLSDAERTAKGWTRGCLGDVLRLTADPVSVRPAQSYPNVGVLSFARGLFAKPPIAGAATSAATLYRIRAGQFLYSRLFAFEGAYAIVEQEHDGAFVSNEFPSFDIDPERAAPAFLYAYFRSPGVWEAIARGSKGLGDRRQRVKPDQVLNHQLWLPPRRQLDRLATLVPAVADLRSRHITIREANAALLPAVLERLFVAGNRSQ